MKITNVEKLTNERWLNLFAASFEHNGHQGRWVFASRRDKPYSGHTAEAVIVAPILRNPGLLTVPAVECLAPADLVFYDYLVPVQLLDYAPDAARRVGVNELADHHPSVCPRSIS